MANASGSATDRLIPGSYSHPLSGAEYAVSRNGDGAVLSYRLHDPEPVSGSERLRYFLGSGHLGLTYLYEQNNYWFESPIAYYDALKAYSMKPGLERDRTATAALPLHPACLRCHMSGVQKTAEGSDNLYPQGPFREVGITCESCHGDTHEHVSSGGKILPVNPLKLTPEKRDSVCIVCHLEGDTSVERRGRNVLDFKPGEDISDYLSFYMYSGENTTRRAVSEIEQFRSSRCKLVTGPGMSCSTCHNPHLSPAAAERPSFYRSKCLTCHVETKLSRPVHNVADADCVGCHMPKTGAQNVPHVAWTDHRIRRRPAEADLLLTTMPSRITESAELVPILRTDENGTRDLGLAYTNLATGGIAAAREKAWTLLKEAESAGGTADVALLRALGLLAQAKGDRAAAGAYYRSALKVDPNNLIVRTNLGALLAYSGDLEAAADLWRRSFEVNRDVPSLGQNLAIIECGLGNGKRANDILADVLAYNPGLSPVRKLQEQIATGQRPCERRP